VPVPSCCTSSRLALRRRLRRLSLEDKGHLLTLESVSFEALVLVWNYKTMDSTLGE
jgi:hypothetical protein